MKDALAIHRMLLDHGTRHEIVRLRNSIACADDLPSALGLPTHRCLAVRLYQASESPGRSRGGGAIAGQPRPVLVAAVTPSGSMPTRGAVGNAVGADTVSPAATTHINAITGYASNLVAPLLLPEHVTILLAQRLTDMLAPDDVVYTPTGERQTVLGIGALDLFAICGAKPVDLAEVPGYSAGIHGYDYIPT